MNLILYSIFVVLAIELELPSISSAAEKEVSGTEQGNGGDQIRIMFSEAKINSNQELNKILECSFSAQTDSLIKQWVLEHKFQLVQDIINTPHIWLDSNGHKTCAWTQSKPNAEILFSFVNCKNESFGLKHALELLVHESAHHLGVTDESKADLIALAVANAVQADDCRSDGTPVLSFTKGTISDDGSLAATTPNENGQVSLWDLQTNRELFTVRDSRLKVNNGKQIESLGFTTNKKYYFLFLKYGSYYGNSNDSFSVSKSELAQFDLETASMKIISLPATTYRINLHPDPSYDGLHYLFDASRITEESSPRQYFAMVYEPVSMSFQLIPINWYQNAISFRADSNVINILSNPHLNPNGFPKDNDEKGCVLRAYDLDTKKFLIPIQIDYDLPEIYSCYSVGVSPNGRFYTSLLSSNDSHKVIRHWDLWQNKLLWEKTYISQRGSWVPSVGTISNQDNFLIPDFGDPFAVHWNNEVFKEIPLVGFSNIGCYHRGRWDFSNDGQKLAYEVFGEGSSCPSGRSSHIFRVVDLPTGRIENEWLIPDTDPDYSDHPQFKINGNSGLVVLFKDVLYHLK